MKTIWCTESEDKMLREFSTWRDPYGVGYSTCKPKKIAIGDGLTVLVGCNGSGKSTLLRNIESELKSKNIPVVLFDNGVEKRSNAIGAAISNGNVGLASNFMTASEGEAIGLHLGQFMYNLRNFVITGIYSSAHGLSENKFLDAFSKLSSNTRKEKPQSDERWLLMDSVDSGYSIDAIRELKKMFNIISKDAISKNVHLYIVIAANAYELAKNEQCFNVQLGKYVTFNNYEEYAKFVLKTRKLKDERIERAEHNKSIKEWKKHHEGD